MGAQVANGFKDVITAESRKEFNEMKKYANEFRETMKYTRRGGQVSRFHTHPRARPEDVAQHVYGALSLLHLLTGGGCRIELTWALLFHDNAEQKWGDIPSPSKKMLGDEFRAKFNVLEDETNAEHGMLYELTKGEHVLLKFCDNLDGLLSCVEEFERGNRIYAEPYRNFRNYTESMFTSENRELVGEGAYAMAMNVLLYAIEKWRSIGGIDYVG
jgi:5'-deoxynucleotidase YfbR-like HD superfamily hydrolase